MQKKFLRIVASVLSFLIIVNSQSVFAFATTESKMKISVESVAARPGEYVQVEIEIANNPGIASLKFNVDYDKYLTLTNVEFSSDFGAYVTAPTPYKNPQTISMISPLSEVKANGTFATLTFFVASDIPENYDAKISLTYDEDEFFDIDYNNVPFEAVNGCVSTRSSQPTTGFSVRAVPVSGMAGETVSVNIDISNNPGISSLKLNVAYDEYLSLTDVEFNNDFGSYVTAPTPYKNPQALSMISPLKDVSSNGTFATLKFKISDNAPSGYVANITITYDADNVFNADFENVLLNVVNGYVTIGGTDTDIFTMQVGNAVVSDKTVHVDVILSNNPGLASLKFNVNYDSYLTLTDVKFNSAFGAYVTAPTPYKNPQTISMISPLSDVSADGVFATLTFAVKDDVPDNYTADISINFDDDDIFNGNYENIKTRVINGSVCLGNTIMPKEGTDTVIDRTEKIIYGLGTNITDINDYVDCSKVEASIVPTKRGLGTGTTINVMRNGEISEKYTVVVFGDVNGDSLCDGTDAVILSCLISGMLTRADVGEAIWTAADCNHDGFVDNNDIELLRNVGVLNGEITQIA